MAFGLYLFCLRVVARRSNLLLLLERTFSTVRAVQG